jgi:hypothetical protein
LLTPPLVYDIDAEMSSMNITVALVSASYSFT